VARFTAETPLLSCRKLVQTMALSSVASDALRRSKAPIRKRKVGPRSAVDPGDRRLRVNKAWRRESLATLEKRAKDRAEWANDQFEEASEVFLAFLRCSFSPLAFCARVGFCGVSRRSNSDLHAHRLMDVRSSKTRRHIGNGFHIVKRRQACVARPLALSSFKPKKEALSCRKQRALEISRQNRLQPLESIKLSVHPMRWPEIQKSRLRQA